MATSVSGEGVTDFNRTLPPFIPYCLHCPIHRVKRAFWRRCRERPHAGPPLLERLLAAADFYQISAKAPSPTLILLSEFLFRDLARRCGGVLLRFTKAGLGIEPSSRLH